MDGQRFDNLARSLALTTSRRGFVKTAAAAVAAIGGGAALAGSGAAVICRQNGVICAKNAHCCTGYCDDNHRCACPPGLTACGGDCLDLMTDAQNCSGCGQACTLSHASSICAGGSCAVGACDADWADCDGDPSNGCETDLTTTSNCGACGANCDLQHASSTCSGGNCAIASCEDGYADCNDTASDGCETHIASDARNCGACNNACDLPHATSTCSDGTCTIVACDAGWANCDGDDSTGCETDITTTSNCGACGNTCDLPHATSICDNGTCAIDRCDDGYRDCNGVASDGCEVDITSDAQHCGGCDTACTSDNDCLVNPGTCENSVCSFSNQSNGVSCSGGSKCFVNETCTAGVCGGGTELSCTTPPVCHTTTNAYCSWATGCVYPDIVGQGTRCTAEGVSNGICDAGGTCFQCYTGRSIGGNCSLDGWTCCNGCTDLGPNYYECY